MNRRALAAIVIFLGVGEAMIRFDASTLFFQGGQRLENSAKHSPELEALNNGRFRLSPSTFRVMVVGDSYLYGAGVRPDNVFANQLRERLRSARFAGFDEVSVVDLTKPGSNTYTNVRDFKRYSPGFQPHVVVLAYNANDVYGSQRAVADRSNRALPGTDGDTLERVRAFRRVVHSSQLAKMILVKVNLELKLAGIVMPGTEFDHQVNKSHSADYAGWIQSRGNLQEMIEYCHDRNIHLLVANMPELNMLGNRKLYGRLEDTIATYFRSLRVDYINGAEPFMRAKNQEFAISRYDGHPNDAAHRVTAEFVFEHLRQSYRPASLQTGVLRSTSLGVLTPIAP